MKLAIMVRWRRRKPLGRAEIMAAHRKCITRGAATPKPGEVDNAEMMESWFRNHLD